MDNDSSEKKFAIRMRDTDCKILSSIFDKPIGGPVLRKQAHGRR